MIADPIEAGLAGGWQVEDASTFVAARDYEVDVVIVGTGAGGGIAAEILARAGLRVMLVEEGPLRSSRNFHMRESEAYPELYQESAARKTRDKAINILQGRCVGGSTTVNWTSSFRTPTEVLAFWAQHFGVEGLSEADLAPWFSQVEQRLSMRAWETEPNANNALLRRGAEAIGIATGVIARNVRGCWNLGYCGMGCPTNAKQSMLVTTVPSALDRGAVLLTRLRAQRLLHSGTQVRGLECTAMDPKGIFATGHPVQVRARHYVLAAGAIGSPALLMRSAAPDPHRRLGRRTFLHPSVISAANMPDKVAGHAGAPQSIYSDHFLHQAPIDGPLGFKLEAPPLHPLLFSITLQGFGTAHAELMAEFANAQVLIALLRDGFNANSQGGTVALRDDGTPVLDYPLEPVVWEAARRAWLAMAEIQFAAGARRVYAVHERCKGYSSWNEAKQGIAALPLQALQARVVSAHVMGGCGMAGHAERGVVDATGRHHQMENLSVFDGSVFPTSLGVNPQLSIYGLTARNASRLATALTGRPAPALEAAQ